MAHNIASINGQDAIAYLDQTPWHGLGQKLNLGNVPAAERIDAALDAAQLRYEVGSQPLYLADGTPVAGFKASVRLAADGSVAAQLGVVGEGYTHVSNVEATGILRPLAEEFGAVPAAMGALGNGEKAWALMRLADAVATPLPGDDVNGYFLLNWDHTGNGGVNGMGTGIRVICQNTLNMATGSGRAKQWFSIRHTSSAAGRLDEAARLMKAVLTNFAKTGETFATMAHKRLDAKGLAAYLAGAIPNTDSKAKTVSPVIVARRDTVARLVFFGRGAAMANQAVDTRDGSASVWAAYNAVTEYFDHVRPAEAQSAAGLQRAHESAVFGGNADLKAGALQLARELVAA